MAETRYHNQIPKAMEIKADAGIRMVGTADEKTVCTLCKCASILMRKVNRLLCPAIAVATPRDLHFALRSGEFIPRDMETVMQTCISKECCHVGNDVS